MVEVPKEPFAGKSDDWRNGYEAGRAAIENLLHATRAAGIALDRWQPIDTAPTGDDDFFLVCSTDAGDDRSPFVVRGSIFKSARQHPRQHHLSLAYLTHWMPLPGKPPA